MKTKQEQINEEKERILARMGKVCWTQEGRTPGTKAYKYVEECERALYALDLLEDRGRQKLTDMPFLFYFGFFTQ